MVSCLQAATAMAQPHPQIQMSSEQYTLAAGVPQSSINAIVAAPDGFVWLATFGGSARFDSQKFLHLRTGGDGEIAMARAATLARAADGRIWIGSVDGGLGIVDGLSVKDANPPALRHETIFALAPARDGTMWAATASGVFHVLPSGDARQFTTANGLAATHSFRLAIDGDGIVWAVGQGGISRIAGDQASVVALAAAEIPTYPPASIAIDPAGTAWLALTTRGGMLQRADQSTPARLGFLSSTDFVTSLSFTNDGAAWIGTWERRLLRLADGVMTEIVFAKPSRASVRTVVDALDGGYWVGTDVAGLFRLRPAVVERLTTAVPPASANGVTADADGNIYVALGCDGVRRISRTGDTRVYHHPGMGCTWSVLAERDGTLLVGHSEGAVRWRLGERPVAIPALAGHAVMAFYRDRGGTLWVGTNTGGAFRIRENHVAQWAPSNGPFPSTSAQVFHEDGNGIWIGTGRGLVRIEDDRITRSIAALDRVTVRAIASDGNGGLWVGTSGRGLWHVRGDAVSSFTSEDGLGDDTVSWIHADHRGRVWFTGNRGVHRVTVAELTNAARTMPLRARTFGLDEHVALECNGGFQTAGLVLPSGHFVVSSLEGPMLINPDRDIPNRTPPPIFVQRAAIDGQPVENGRPIVVAAGARRLEVELLGISYAAPHDLTFEYRLVPYDTSWIPSRSSLVAFTAIPPGDYVFEARAINSDGVLSAAPAAIAVRIEPSFWQTWWFRAAVVMALAAAFVGSVRLYSAAERRRANELRHRVDQAVAELKVLRGLLPICAWCRKVRDDDGAWSDLERYVAEHTDARFTHGICSECLAHVMGKGES